MPNGINKLPSGRWRVKIYHHGATIATRTFTLKKDADTWRTEQYRKLEAGDVVNPKGGDKLLSAVVAEYIDNMGQADNPKTFTTFLGHMVDHVLPALGKQPIGSITEGDLNTLWVKLLKKEKRYKTKGAPKGAKGHFLREGEEPGCLTRGTVSRVRDNVSVVFTYAVSNKLIASNPVHKSRVPKDASPEDLDPRPFDDVEMQAVIDSHFALSPLYARVTEFLLYTGIRWGELKSLKVKDLDEALVPAIWVRTSQSEGFEVKSTKSRKKRSVPLGPEGLRLAQQAAAGREPDAYLFISPRGSQLREPNYRRAIRWVKTAPGHRPHDLRHTAATRWLRAGVDVMTVAKWLGHSTSNVTLNVYSHWMGSTSDIAGLAAMSRSEFRS